MKLETYLETEVRARERNNRDRAIVNILIDKYPELNQVKKETLVEMVKDHSSLEREWRKILQERPELRGKDYDQKEVLEQKTILELGYELGQQKLKL